MFTHNHQTLAIETAILSGATNLFIEASPGTGKTTVGTEVIARQFSKLYGNYGASLVFSSKNKTGNTKAMEAAGLPASVATINGLGFNILKQSVKYLKIHGGQYDCRSRKLMPDKITDISKDTRFDALSEKEREFAIKTTANAKALNLNDLSDNIQWNKAAIMASTEFDLIDKVISVSKEMLKISDSMQSIIDFDDQVRFPVLLNLPVANFNWLIIDEAQDLNPANLALLNHIISKQASKIPVAILGDKKQSIYGFRGALASEMQKLATSLNCQSFPLTICYRCASVICENANGIYPDSMIPHNTLGTGSVGNLPYSEFIETDYLTNLSTDTFVLCRNNAPLAKILFFMMRNGISAFYQGGAKLALDLRNRVLAASYRHNNTDDLMLIRSSLLNYLESQEQKCADKGYNPPWLGDLKDKVETLTILIDGLISTNQNSKKDLLDFLKKCFEEPKASANARITLATYHGSKGLQRNACYLIEDEKLCPCKYATTPEEIEQEINLTFMARTRAQEKLFFVKAGEKNK